MRKRLFDILFSFSMLVLCSPLLLCLILLMKATSKGPVFFKGTRMGQGGHLISCWKFRTMCVGAKNKLTEILNQNSSFRQEWEIFHKLKKDPRITKIGKFLRKTSLDELPQFWNVLKGDLSVVGPRPVEIYHPENAQDEIRRHFRDKADKILTVKPGITCIWQTSGRNELPLERLVELEETYVNHQSFWLDLKIICKTVYILLFPKGAY
ncbi:MAG: UDP-glucose:undecaprenyl-phosphate glucose-1-phosphate transferase [Chlamydiae bacterium]|nr:UDP-glucose:undecaprenyl-phosphate glucose-1-phosphate transferase [Chlamydiota bacterium]